MDLRVLLPCLALLCAAPPAAAGGPGTTDTGRGDFGCSDQALVGGVRLPVLSDLYTLMNKDTAWGAPALVDLVMETAVAMRTLYPDASPLVVGDLSRQRGGVLPPHRTHRGGVDVDLGLYRTGRFQPKGILPFPANEFDLETNFDLIATLLVSDQVDLILLDRVHIARLRAWAIENERLTPEQAVRWFPPEGSRAERQDTGVVRHVSGHDGHLHVRILCPDGSRAE